MLLKVLSALLFIQGSVGLKCYDDVAGIHGIPEPDELEQKECSGAASCAKITGKIDGEDVNAWSCGSAEARTGCVSGIPEGVEFNVGDTVSDTLTCFCKEELCNNKTFCDSCTAGNSGSRVGFTFVTFVFFAMLLS